MAVSPSADDLLLVVNFVTRARLVCLSEHVPLWSLHQKIAARPVFPPRLSAPGKDINRFQFPGYKKKEDSLRG